MAELPLTTALLQSGIDDGLHPGAQLYVSRDGNTLADIALGVARPGVAMMPDTPTLWMSSTKPVAAVAVGQLLERDLLKLDDPVALHLPEFAAGGKQDITVRQLLNHTGGFRGLAGNWETGTWDDVISRVMNARLETGWPPGLKAGYHVATSWYVLGELVRRLDGRPFSQCVREAIFQPIGMDDSWIGMPASQYERYGDRLSLTYDTSRAGPIDAPRPTNFNDGLIGVTSTRPASNGRGPARALAYFYEMLLAGGQRNGARILAHETVHLLTSRARIGMVDCTFRHIMDWGLGFMVNSRRYGVDTVPYGFGPHASDRAFGHAGHQSSVAFADGDHGLAIALIFNGMPGEAKHHARMRSILKTLYEELDISRQD